MISDAQNKQATTQNAWWHFFMKRENKEIKKFKKKKKYSKSIGG